MGSPRLQPVNIWRTANATSNELQTAGTSNGKLAWFNSKTADNSTQTVHHPGLAVGQPSPVNWTFLMPASDRQGRLDRPEQRLINGCAITNFIRACAFCGGALDNAATAWCFLPPPNGVDFGFGVTAGKPTNQHGAFLLHFPTPTIPPVERHEQYLTACMATLYCCIVGSAVVWRLAFFYNPFFFLPFVKQPTALDRRGLDMRRSTSGA